MKSKIFILIVLISMIKLTSCKKDSNDNDNNNNNTNSAIPVISTVDVTTIKSTSAQSGGNITSDGGSAVVARGVCWGTAQMPTISDNKTTNGSGSGSFSSNISGLTSNTVYYVRAYATNSVGTAYGSEKTFTTTQPPSPVVDADGNSYPVVEIGDQVWMAANLKVTNYSAGGAIPLLTDDNSWTYTTQGAYCFYNNQSANIDEYGMLYNWYAASDSRNICPAGWHVPTDAEWTVMENVLGGYTVAGGKLKETGTTHWQTPNTGATNESGFTGLPGGERIALGSFDDLNQVGLWWTATEVDATGSYTRGLNYSYDYISHGTVMKGAGFSIRCVKN